MNWCWLNNTQIIYGINCIKDFFHTLIAPKSKILCLFGDHFTDIKSFKISECFLDIQSNLQEMQCSVKWEDLHCSIQHENGCIFPDYDRLIEIITVVKKENPDLIIAVGDQTAIDGTKFVAMAAQIPEDLDPWEAIVVKNTNFKDPLKFSCIITNLTNGSEWNSAFAITRQIHSEKVLFRGRDFPTFPVFSIIDRKYIMKMGIDNIKSTIFEAIINIIDQCIIPTHSPMLDDFFFYILKELIELSNLFVVAQKDQNKITELFDRLVPAILFGHNKLFGLGKKSYCGIRLISDQIAMKYNLRLCDCMMIVATHFLENQFAYRMPMLAIAATKVFNVVDGSTEEKARWFIMKFKQLLDIMKMPRKISDISSIESIFPDDINDLTNQICLSFEHEKCNKRQQMAKDDIRFILKRIFI